MCKQRFHIVFSTLMAFLVLFSTFYITIEKHLCGNVLVDVAIFTQAEKCQTETLETALGAVAKKDCCKDELELIKGQDVLKLTTFDELHLDLPLFIVAYPVYLSDHFVGLPERTVPHKNYSPPNLVFDIHLLDQVFII